MISGRQVVPIRLSEILKKVSEYDVYRTFFRDFEVEELYKSPFRRDSTPSFCIYVTKDKTLRHIDYGKREYQGNCVDFIKQFYGLEYKDALLFIDKGMNLGIWSYKDSMRPTITKTEKEFEYVDRDTIIQIKPKKFTEADIAYWKEIFLDIHCLGSKNVYSVDQLWINKIPIAIKEELVFAYLFKQNGKEYIKIYTPYAEDKKRKFLTNVPGDLMPLIYELPKKSNVCIVTKSYKDQMVLSLVHSDVTSIQSESHTAISPENADYLNSNYDRVIILLDNDETGIKTSNFYKEMYGFHPIFIPKEIGKDSSDFVKAKGLEEFRQFIEKESSF